MTNTSLGLYIHVPFCKHACPYCDFYKVELRDYPARARLEFPAALAGELNMVQLAHSDWFQRPLETIYFGGGTPSTLNPEGVKQFIEFVRSVFPVETGVEITLEANPENLTPARAEQWLQAGINRLSLGVQSFDDGELKLLERLHDAKAIRRGYTNARNAGFKNISIDLMFALPNQSIERWKENLYAGLELVPDHFSFYGLTYHEGTPFQTQLEKGKLAETDEELQAAMYMTGSEMLKAAGFEHYEISNFAKPGFRSKHNQRYWTRKDVLGLGPGAHSNVGNRRWANPPDLEAWAGTIVSGGLPWIDLEELDAQGEQSERLFTLLRRIEGIVPDDDKVLFNMVKSWCIKNPEMASIINRTNDRIHLTNEGWLLMDGVIESIIGEA